MIAPSAVWRRPDVRSCRSAISTRAEPPGRSSRGTARRSATPKRDDPYWAARDFSARRSGRSRHRCRSWAAGTTSSCPGCSPITPPSASRPVRRHRLTIGAWAHTHPGSSRPGTGTGSPGWSAPARRRSAALRRPGADPRDRRAIGRRLAGPGRLATAGHRGAPAVAGRRGTSAGRRAGRGHAGLTATAMTRLIRRPRSAARSCSAGTRSLDNRALEARDDVLVYTGGHAGADLRGGRRRSRRAVRVR